MDHVPLDESSFFSPSITSITADAAGTPAPWAVTERFESREFFMFLVVKRYSGCLLTTKRGILWSGSLHC